VEDLLYVAVSAAGAATFWWRFVRRRGPAARRAELAQDEELEIVLHVAGHAARSRGHELSADHLLFALLQSDPVAAAIRGTGGDVAALEDTVLAALDGGDADGPPREPGRADPAAAAVATALALAKHNRRLATCADLWFALSRAARGLGARLEAAGVDATSVLFALTHGIAERDLPAPQPDEVELLLINDDFSPQELVVEVLRDGLGLPEAEATRLMLKTHHEGQASLGRRPGAHAHQTTRTALARARQRGYPLWIRLVP